VHYIMNQVIEPTPDGAVGKAYLIELNWDVASAQAAGGAGRGAATGSANGWDIVGRKAGELARTGGHYEDVYVKTPVGWRFKKRDFIPSTSGADPAPLPPPNVPAAAAPIGISAPLAAAANYIAPTQQMSLTATDYLEIAQLVASYGHALDSGYGKGENGEAYASLYTADASFAGSTGHDQLVRLGQIQPRGPDFVRHYLTNHVIEPIPGGAKGKEFLAVIDNGENGKPSSLFLGGHYEDTYVKTTQGWRIKTRQLFRPQSGPQPQAQPATTPSAVEGAGTAGGAVSASPLSGIDTIEIQQLIARSAYALDTAIDRGAAYAQLYTQDGAFITKTVRPVEIKGRTQLAAFAAGDLTHRGPAFVREYLTNYIVYPSRTGATGRVYLVWIEVGENGTPGIIQGGGHYEDEYVKTREGWRIGRRTFVPSKLGPRDIYDVDRTPVGNAPASRAQDNNAAAPARPVELTALDYLQIQQLVARYAQYIDTCSNNGYDYADLFAEDGFFAPFPNGQLGRKAQGREALARVSGGGPDGCTGAGWIRQGVHHIYVNHIIEPTPEGAKGQVNMLMIGLGGDKNKIEHDGYYEDTYVKTTAGWKFKSRIHHTTYDPAQK
jgi:SnoaL-like domain